jgi:hypothetical protein
MIGYNVKSGFLTAVEVSMIVCGLWRSVAIVVTSVTKNHIVPTSLP